MYVLVVKIQVKPDQVEAFKVAATEDSKGSTTNEPGCLGFDVLQDLSDPTTFMFVEVYKDEAAFQAHTKMPHFDAWREATKDMFASPPEAVRCTNVWPPDSEWAGSTR